MTLAIVALITAFLSLAFFLTTVLINDVDRLGSPGMAALVMLIALLVISSVVTIGLSVEEITSNYRIVKVRAEAE